MADWVIFAIVGGVGFVPLVCLIVCYYYCSCCCSSDKKEDYRSRQPPFSNGNVLKRSSSTHVPVSDTLDLHGYGMGKAKSEIMNFLTRKKKEFYSEGKRFVRIITGRGIHSKRGPVLKSMTREYLSRNRCDYEWDRAGGSVTIDLRSV